jgi:hypothetical protein
MLQVGATGIEGEEEEEYAYRSFMISKYRPCV